MQPPAFRTHDRSVKELWELFVAGRGEIDERLHTYLDPSILRSWRRCYPRLDPLNRPQLNSLHDNALRNVITARFDLIAISRPFMEDIYQFVEGSQCVVLLTDAASCILEIVGDAAMIERLGDHGMGRGTYLSEGSIGTNAVALCLREATPIQVVGAEHYLKLLHTLSDAAAPLHNVTGRIIGTLAIVSGRDNAHSHTLAAVMSGARAIENQLQTDMYLQEANRRLTELHSVFAAMSEGILSWNRAGKITHINEQAGTILGVKPQSVLGRPLEEVFTLPANIEAAALAGESLRDVEASFGVNGRTVNCLVSTRPILEGTLGPVGCLVTLRPIERVHRLVHRLLGTEASLTLDHVLGESASMKKIRRQARLAARGRAPILLRGEDGAGKNPLARAIHNGSDRADGPFISLNCLAVPHELMISEFLGYEGGTFRDGKSEGRPSKFELADRGTLVLDEIESLSLEMQAALVQVIDTGHVMRLGSNRATPVNVRIIAATSSDLESKVADGNFRSDLYHRFGVFTLDLPPLRDRAEDIPLLVERFLERIRRQSGRNVTISDEALDVLMQYPWPGNIRELENVLDGAIVHSGYETIHPGSLPQTIRHRHALVPDSPRPKPVLSMAEAEREAIMRAGYACNGKVTAMAEKLGIGRTTLWRKMKHFDIDPEYFTKGMKP